MGAALPASDVVGTKVYSTVGGRFNFVILLFSSSTGAALATIEANELTRLRTAAATAVAQRALARRDAKVLTLFGAGTQARAHAEALLLVHPFESVLVCARSGATEFADEIRTQYRVPAQAVHAAEAAANGDVIVTCTRANDPLFDGALVKAGALVAAVGSSKPAARELDDALLARAGRIVVEWLPAARQEAGEFVRAAAGVIDPARVVELGQILAQAPVARDPNEIVVYKSVGIGLEDVALAKLVLDRCGK
jgi:ornithine cyclodeaminase